MPAPRTVDPPHQKYALTQYCREKDLRPGARKLPDLDALVVLQPVVELPRDRLRHVVPAVLDAIGQCVELGLKLLPPADRQRARSSNRVRSFFVALARYRLNPS